MNVKKLSLGAIIASALLLTACQNTQPTTLTFKVPSPTASMQVNQNAVIYVTSRDMRSTPEISSYTSGGQLIKLTAQPSVTDLFRTAEQQNLISKGFRIGQANNSNAGVTVDVKTFYAKVQQGDLKYNIDSKIQLAVHVQGSKGQFTKNFEAGNAQEGMWSAKSDEIQKVMNKTFNDVINAMYNDQEIIGAINQYAY